MDVLCTLSKNPCPWGLTMMIPLNDKRLHQKFSVLIETINFYIVSLTIVYKLDLCFDKQSIKHLFPTYMPIICKGIKDAVLSVIEKVIALQNVDIFGDVPSEQLSYLAAIAEEITAMEGDVLYREQDPADGLYLLLEGKVRLDRAGNEISLAGSGDAFGTWSLFDEEPRVVTATATEESSLLRIDREDFIDLLADHLQITQGVLKSMVKRLRGLMDRVNLGVLPS